MEQAPILQHKELEKWLHHLQRKEERDHITDQRNASLKCERLRKKL